RTLTPTRTASSRCVRPVRPRSWRTSPRKLSPGTSSDGGTRRPFTTGARPSFSGAHRRRAHQECSCPPGDSVGAILEVDTSRRGNEGRRWAMERWSDNQDRQSAMPQSGRQPASAMFVWGVTEMTRTAFAPATTFGSDPVGSADTRLELVSSDHSASGRMALQVLIANCQPIVRHGLRALIVREPDLHVVGETDDGGEAVRLAWQHRPD